MAKSISCLGNVPRRPQPQGSTEIRHPPIVVLCQALARSAFSDFLNCPDKSGGWGHPSIAKQQFNAACKA